VPLGLAPGSKTGSRGDSRALKGSGFRRAVGGTENSDKNPPRIAPRNLFDLSIGQENIFRKERDKVDLDLTAINTTNKYALYNFLSTFSGTHFVTPRALTAKLTFNF
jgi:hypothetical protein